MTTPPELQQAIANLPLAQREALLSVIEQSISDEYDRMAEASVVADIKKIESLLANYPLAPFQMGELESRADAADRGEAHYIPWEQVQSEILAELRRDT